MPRMTILVGTALASIALALAPAPPADAVPVIAPNSEFLFTENRGPNSAGVSSGWKFILGATNVTPSGASTTATGTHVPPVNDFNYTLTFLPGPLFPNQYAVVVPYTGQTGQWDIVATNSTGSSAARRTHVLDHARKLPLINDLQASGPLLTPHLTWNAVNPQDFPSFCSTPGSGGIFPTCAVGAHFYTYQVEVRIVTGTPGNAAPLVFSSTPMPTSIAGTGFTPAPTAFNIPAGVLTLGNEYLFGIRLLDNELEQILSPFPNPVFFSPLENRSTAYLSYTTAVPEPSSLALLGGGLALLGRALRRRLR